MSVSKKDVEYIAKLAHLNLSEDEVGDYTAQLNQILEYMEKLNELNTDDVEPLYHPVENINVFREDIIKKTTSIQDALKNSPDNDGSFFKVPKIIKTD